MRFFPAVHHLLRSTFAPIILAATVGSGCGLLDMGGPPDPFTTAVPASPGGWRQNAELVECIGSLDLATRQNVSSWLDEQARREAAGEPLDITPGAVVADLIDLAYAYEKQKAANAGAPGAPTADKRYAKPKAVPAPLPFADIFKPSDCGDADTDLGSMELYNYCQMIGGLDCGSECPDRLESDLAKMGIPVGDDMLGGLVEMSVEDITENMRFRADKGLPPMGATYWPVVPADANQYMHVWRKGSAFDDLEYVPKAENFVGTYWVDVFIDGGPGAEWEVHGAAMNSRGQWVHYVQGPKGPAKRTSAAP